MTASLIPFRVTKRLWHIWLVWSYGESTTCLQHQWLKSIRWRSEPSSSHYRAEERKSNPMRLRLWIWASANPDDKGPENVRAQFECHEGNVDSSRIEEVRKMNGRVDKALRELNIRTMQGVLRFSRYTILDYMAIKWGFNESGQRPRCSYMKLAISTESLSHIPIHEPKPDKSVWDM